MRVAALLLCVACGGSTTIITGMTGGGSGGSAGGSGSGGSGGGNTTTGCADDAKTVYVVAANRTFSAFDPKTKTFRDIGVLSCGAQPGAQPFSMSVARDAFAYVLYDSGELFRVSTGDLACTRTSFTPDGTFRSFGMGFSTDAVNGTTDTLFIAGGQSVTSMSKLGRLDLQSFAATGQADLVGWPELTGTGDAQLWGFFPETAAGGGSPFVARFDKTTGAFLTNYPATDLAGSATAWAFAFWGGSFWIFLQRDVDLSTQVWEMKASTGSVTNALVSTGRTIVGAGVSTCAPITIN